MTIASYPGWLVYNILGMRLGLHSFNLDKIYWSPIFHFHNTIFGFKIDWCVVGM